MTRRITAAIAVTGLLSLAAGTDALAQKANPCGAKNPCAAKSKDAKTESATVETQGARATQVRGTREHPTAFATEAALRRPGAPPLDSVQSP